MLSRTLFPVFISYSHGLLSMHPLMCIHPPPSACSAQASCTHTSPVSPSSPVISSSSTPNICFPHSSHSNAYSKLASVLKVLQGTGMFKADLHSRLKSPSFWVNKPLIIHTTHMALCCICDSDACSKSKAYTVLENFQHKGV